MSRPVIDVCVNPGIDVQTQWSGCNILSQHFVKLFTDNILLERLKSLSLQISFNCLGNKELLSEILMNFSVLSKKIMRMHEINTYATFPYTVCTVTSPIEALYNKTKSKTKRNTTKVDILKYLAWTIFKDPARPWSTHTGVFNLLPN